MYLVLGGLLRASFEAASSTGIEVNRLRGFGIGRDGATGNESVDINRLLGGGGASLGSRDLRISADISGYEKLDKHNETTH